MLASLCPEPGAVRCSKPINHEKQGHNLASFCTINTLPNSIIKWKSGSICIIPYEKSADLCILNAACTASPRDERGLPVMEQVSSRKDINKPCVATFREDAYLGDLLMPRCDGLFANGLQAANNLCITICGSLAAAAIPTKNIDRSPNAASLSSSCGWQELLSGTRDLDPTPGLPPTARQGTGRLTGAILARTVGASPLPPGAHPTVGAGVVGGR